MSAYCCFLVCYHATWYFGQGKDIYDDAGSRNGRFAWSCNILCGFSPGLGTECRGCGWSHGFPVSSGRFACASPLCLTVGSSEFCCPLSSNIPAKRGTRQVAKQLASDNPLEPSTMAHPLCVLLQPNTDTDVSEGSDLAGREGWRVTLTCSSGASS